MVNIRQNLMNIERPRPLMDAAKSVVLGAKSKPEKLHDERLITLIDQEASLERARQDYLSTYDAKNHISILAQLITQAQLRVSDT